MTQGKADDPCARPLRFPAAIFNRAALPWISYRLGDYQAIREALLYSLDRAAGLERWTYRGGDDPGIALLEGAAIIGDILTFYQELYANEAFLRTASWRESVAALVRLTGYRLRPGLGGVATFALELDGDAAITVPAGHGFKVELEEADGPTQLEAIADTVLYPRLSKLTLCAPQDPGPLKAWTTELRLAAVDPGASLPVLRKGDRLLLTNAKGNSTSLSDLQITLVAEARELHGGLVVTLQGGLVLDASKGEIRAYKLRRNLRHFGSDAPATEVSIDNKTGRATQSEVDYSRSLSGITESHVEPSFGADLVPLANQVDDLGVGVTVICVWPCPKGRGVCIATVKDVQTIGMRWGGLASSTTLVTLNRKLIELGKSATARVNDRRSSAETRDKSDRSAQFGMGWKQGQDGETRALAREPDPASIGTAPCGEADVRAFVIHEVEGAAMLAIARPRDLGGKGKELAFYGEAADARALVGRRIAFTPVGATGPTIARVAKGVVVSDPAKYILGDDGKSRALHTLTLGTSVDYADFPSETRVGAPLTVYANLIDVDQGKSEAAIVLGSGDARARFQAFPIPKSPLTYHRDPASAPPEAPELEVWVQGRAWRRVDVLFGQGPTAEVYTVREDDEGRSYVLFGDGITGARLPSGVDNVTARYRSGSGAHGPQKPGTSVQARPIDVARIKKAHLLGEVTGGCESEAADGARQAAPARVQTLDRLVSPADFAAEALAQSGVLRAEARWDLSEHLPAIVVTVLMESGREFERASIQTSLRKAARCRGPDRVAVMVRLATFEYLQMTLHYGLASGYREGDVRARVAVALGLVEAGRSAGDGLFTATRRGFGEPARASHIEGTVQQVEGVAWCRITALASLGDGDPDTLAPANAMRVEVVATASPARVFRLDVGPKGDLVTLSCDGEEGGSTCD